ncbi:MAG TPA: hypothetical protein VFW50_36445 [Streptosporangiaceae bacterium]|nr:hypothetical protein [Streptosporangiaceae bacterium]
MNHTSDVTAAENGGDFDPQQAAALLDQTTQRARRTFQSSPPLVIAFRAVVVLGAFGGPVGAWLIMAIGLCAVFLATAAVTVWQQHRSVVQP